LQRSPTKAAEVMAARFSMIFGDGGDVLHQATAAAT
jgi:hypothetical protein